MTVSYFIRMMIDPSLITALGDVFINLSAGWFGAAVIVPGTHPRSRQANMVYISMNLTLGIASLALGYKLRILPI